jgi:hypothetical protein
MVLKYCGGNPLQASIGKIKPLYTHAHPPAPPRPASLSLPGLSPAAPTRQRLASAVDRVWQGLGARGERGRRAA